MLKYLESNFVGCNRSIMGTQLKAMLVQGKLHKCKASYMLPPELLLSQLVQASVKTPKKATPKKATPKKATPKKATPKKAKARGKKTTAGDSKAAAVSVTAMTAMPAAEPTLCPACERKEVADCGLFAPFCSRFCQALEAQSLMALTQAGCADAEGGCDAEAQEGAGGESGGGGSAAFEAAAGEAMLAEPTPAPPPRPAPRAAPAPTPDAPAQRAGQAAVVELRVEFSAWNYRPLRLRASTDDKVSRVAEAIKAAMCWEDMTLNELTDGRTLAKGAVDPGAAVGSLRAAPSGMRVLRAAEICALLDDSDSD